MVAEYEDPRLTSSHQYHQVTIKPFQIPKKLTLSLAEQILHLKLKVREEGTSKKVGSSETKFGKETDLGEGVREKGKSQTRTQGSTWRK